MDPRSTNALLTMASQMMTEEQILEKLAKALHEYRDIRSDKNKSSVFFYCMLFLQKGAVEDMGFEAVISRVDEMVKTQDLLKTKGAKSEN